MKSGINILRFLLLLFLFPAFNVKADFYPVSFAVSSLPAYCQDATSVNNPQGNPDTNSRGRKNATPIIMLSVLPQEGRIAQLSWTSSDYSIPGTYYVERLDPIGGGWITLKQLPYDTVLVYNDTISSPFCLQSIISYQVRFISGLDNTTTSIETVSLYDQTSPPDVLNLNASISTTGYPVITWTAVPGTDVAYYWVLRDAGGVFGFHTRLSNAANSYEDRTVTDACSKSYRYLILSFDGCNIRSAPDYDLFVETINLSVQTEECQKFAELTWNSNNTMPGGGIGGYRIYRNDGITNSIITDTQQTSYTDFTNFENLNTYTYTVEAYSKDGLYTSSSCQIGFTYSGAIVPDTVDITQVTVENDSLIRVRYHLYPAGSVQKLVLERSDDGVTNFQAIDSVAFPVSVPLDSFFIDTAVNVYAQSYYYRLVAFDYCLDPKPSLISQSIFLDCFTSETENTLQWNKYEYWIEGVKEYDIYRVINGTPPTTLLLDSVDQNTISITDPLTSYDNSKAVCYWIEGIKNPGNYLNNTISVSNTCCILKEPVLYLPNAFHPYGTNRRFRPVPEFLYVDTQSFKMTIFSRWGQQLFETTDIVNGWDGTINGQDAPADQYSYVITYKSLEDKEYSKRGTVTLVR